MKTYPNMKAQVKQNPITADKNWWKDELRSFKFYCGFIPLVMFVFCVVLLVPVAVLGFAIKIGTPAAIDFAKALIILGIILLPTWLALIKWFQKYGEKVVDSINKQILILLLHKEIYEVLHVERFSSQEIAPPVKPPRRSAVSSQKFISSNFSFDSNWDGTMTQSI